MRTYYLHGGKAAQDSFRTLPRFTLEPSQELQELTVVANFVEVWLAKRATTVRSVNFLRKVEIPLPFGLFGAMLAGVDYVIVGAGKSCSRPPRDDPHPGGGRGSHDLGAWSGIHLRGSTVGVSNT